MTGRLHWPGPSATLPVAAGRRPARPPLPAIRDLDRAPPPPIRSAASPPSTRPPPPPSAPTATGRRSAGPASRCGGGGARTPPSWHQLGEKRKCWLWGLKNRSHKIDESSIFAPKGAPFIFRQVLKNHGDRTNTSENMNKKHEGRAESAPPPSLVAHLSWFDVVSTLTSMS